MISIILRSNDFNSTRLFHQHIYVISLLTFITATFRLTSASFIEILRKTRAFKTLNYYDVHWFTRISLPH